MPTNALGRGTVNISINVPAQWRSLIGRAAFRSSSRSMGDYIRRATERMLEDEYPELAKEIQTVREKHRLAARVMVTRAAGAVLLGFFLYVASHSPEMRRPRRRDEIVNVEDGEQVEVA